MGGKQLGFSDYELTTAKKQTKREKFLSEMEVVVPAMPAYLNGVISAEEYNAVYANIVRKY